MFVKVDSMPSLIVVEELTDLVSPRLHDKRVYLCLLLTESVDFT